MGILTGSWNTNCALEGGRERRGRKREKGEGERETEERVHERATRNMVSRVERTFITRTLNLVAHVHTALSTAHGNGIAKSTCRTTGSPSY